MRMRMRVLDLGSRVQHVVRGLLARSLSADVD